MPKNIGPTFITELAAAGLPGIGYTLGGTKADLCINGKMWADLTPAEQAPYQVVLDAHDPLAEPTAPPDPDADLKADILAANNLSELKLALTGDGPNQAEVRGRKPTS